MTDAQVHEMNNGALLIRFMECDRRLERTPRARWLYQRREQCWAELELRKAVGVLSPALCGILSHHLSASGGITPCHCFDS